MIYSVKNENEQDQLTWYEKLELFMHKYRTHIFWVLIVGSVILLLYQKECDKCSSIENKNKVLKGGNPLALAKMAKGNMGSIGGLVKGKLEGKAKSPLNLRGLGSEKGVGNYMLSQKYKISALIQTIAITVLFLMLFVPPLAFAIVVIMSYSLLSPHLKGLFRL